MNYKSIITEKDYEFLYKSLDKTLDKSNKDVRFLLSILNDIVNTYEEDDEYFKVTDCFDRHNIDKSLEYDYRIDAPNDYQNIQANRDRVFNQVEQRTSRFNFDKNRNNK